MNAADCALVSGPARAPWPDAEMDRVGGRSGGRSPDIVVGAGEADLESFIAEPSFRFGSSDAGSGLSQILAMRRRWEKLLLTCARSGLGLLVTRSAIAQCLLAVPRRIRSPSTDIPGPVSTGAKLRPGFPQLEMAPCG